MNQKLCSSGHAAALSHTHAGAALARCPCAQLGWAECAAPAVRGVRSGAPGAHMRAGAALALALGMHRIRGVIAERAP